MTWRVRVTVAADTDFEGIFRWTMDRFGADQSLIYDETIRAALRALADGPQTPGTTARQDLGENLYTLHIARAGRHGRHFILFRVEIEDRTVEVLRILHDAMDIARHVPTNRRAPR